MKTNTVTLPQKKDLQEPDGAAMSNDQMTFAPAEKTAKVGSEAKKDQDKSANDASQNMQSVDRPVSHNKDESNRTPHFLGH